MNRISNLTVPMLLWIGFFQMLALIPGTSRSGATIVGALIIGVSREVAAISEYPEIIFLDIAHQELYGYDGKYK